jgi:hypothetical protein
MYTGLVCNRTKSNTIVSAIKKDVDQRQLSNEEQQKIDTALTKAIIYTHDIGEWLEDLFDAQNNIPYAEHVAALRKIVVDIEQDLVMPLNPNENTHVTLVATHQFAVLLLHRIENTYAVLESYCDNNYLLAHYRLGMALKKVLNSSRDKAQLDEVLQVLHTQLQVLAPALDTKLNDLKNTIKLYSERINNRNWHTLVDGLSHRLGC